MGQTAYFIKACNVLSISLMECSEDALPATWEPAIKIVSTTAHKNRHMLAKSKRTAVTGNWIPEPVRQWWCHESSPKTLQPRK